MLLPIPPDRRLLRLLTLAAGLALYGASLALMLRAGIGLSPWDVLHQGLSRRLGGPVGVWVNIVGVLVLLTWIPLRQRPGLGTIANVLAVGTVLDVALPLLPHPQAVGWQVVMLAAGIVLNGVATGLYIGAGLGPGPRDGLMTGLAARGVPLRVARTGIELGVLLVGWLLGGTVGVGTVAYAVLIGPLAHVFVPRLALDRPVAGARTVTAQGTAPQAV